MGVTFKQVSENKDISEIEGFGTILVSSFIIVGIGLFMIKIANIHPIVTVLTMLALGWLGRPLTRKLFGDYANNSDIIGELALDTTSITWINNNGIQVLNCSDIDSIILRYNYIQGQQFAFKDIIHNGLAIMTIQTKLNHTAHVKFLIETKQQLEELKPVWKDYYQQKIKIKEIMGKYEVRTLLFEKVNFSFDEMQEFKKGLNEGRS